MIQSITKDEVEVRKEYYESGALWAESPYENGERHGIEKTYYETGALWWETPYVNGERHGIVKCYYRSGNLLAETPYVNGERHGIEKSYEDDKSNICRLALYEKGHKVASVKNLIYKETNHASG